MSHLIGHSKASSYLRMLLFLIILVTFSLNLLPSGLAEAADESRYFPQTGFTVSGAFYNFWRNHGGLAQFGYPITPPLTDYNAVTKKDITIQWFERERFELHPENAGTPYEVELGLLGHELTSNRTNEPAFQRIAPFPNSPTRTYYPQTGHSLSFGFKSYWERNGGLAIYGYPIAEEFQEVSRTDGKIYTVQYFERARFEYHPNNPPAYQVELGLLGRLLLQAGTVSQSPILIEYNYGSGKYGIKPGQTLIMPYVKGPLVVTLHFPKPIDPAQIQPQLLDEAVPGHWHITPIATSDLTTYPFYVEADYQPGDYVTVGVTLGMGRSPVVFGVQLGDPFDSSRSFVADWSDPIGLINSHYNAINRQESQRAYSYWQPKASQQYGVSDYNDFIGKYTFGGAFEVTTGDFRVGAAAGTAYYPVPVVVTGNIVDAGRRSYYGCYLLTRSNVDTDRGSPPFPLKIRAAHLFLTPAGSDPNRLLDQATDFVKNGQCTQ